MSSAKTERANTCLLASRLLLASLNTYQLFLFLRNEENCCSSKYDRSS